MKYVADVGQALFDAKLTLVSGLMSSEITPQSSIELSSEFASVRITADQTGRGSRLAITDLENGTVAYFDALELSSLVHATNEQRRDWMRTGPYAETPQAPETSRPPETS